MRLFTHTTVLQVMELIVPFVTLSFTDLRRTQTICAGQLAYNSEQGLFRDLLQLRDGRRVTIQRIE